MNQPTANQRRRAQSLFLLSHALNESEMPASLPQLVLYPPRFPLQSEFTYRANWRPTRAKRFSGLTPRATIAQHTIHPTPGFDCIKGSKLEGRPKKKIIICGLHLLLPLTTGEELGLPLYKQL